MEAGKELRAGVGVVGLGVGDAQDLHDARFDPYSHDDVTMTWICLRCFISV